MDLEFLKIRRKEKGLTQNDLSSHFGYSRQNYSQKEIGKQRFKLDEIRELMNILSLTPEEIVRIFL